MALHFLNDVANTKLENYVLIASLKSETMCKLINIIPEACSTMRALGVLSSTFSLNAGARQGSCKRCDSSR